MMSEKGNSGHDFEFTNDPQTTKSSFVRELEAAGPDQLAPDAPKKRKNKNTIEK